MEDLQINIQSTEASQSTPDIYEPLYFAALNGDWKTASEYFDRNSNTFTFRIPSMGMTLLQAAIWASQWRFAIKLIQRTPAEALAAQDVNGFTALHYVVIGGNIETTKALANRNPSLANIPDSNGLTPLCYAIFDTKNQDLVRYLASVTTDDSPGFAFTGPAAAILMCNLTAAGCQDVVLFLLQNYPRLALATKNGWSAILLILLATPSYFLSSSDLGFFERCIYKFVPVEVDHLVPNHLRGEILPNQKNPLSPSQTQASRCYQFVGFAWNIIGKLVPGVQRIRDTKFRHKCTIKLVEIVCKEASTINELQFKNLFVNTKYLRTAISLGIFEFIEIYLQHFPYLLPLGQGHETLVHDATRYRREKIFRYFLRKYPLCRASLLATADESDVQTTSHLVAKLTLSPEIASISGAAFQMQKELLWFKEVENLDQPFHKNVKNNGRTPWVVFREEHRSMLEQGERWMKDTSNSCMLVATLIATVVFAAAFTVPGGNNQENGTPIFLQDKTFMVFAMSDAVALFSSITSLLIFLSILTARYAEEDFLKTLPQRLILGLASLFFAIAATMVAFGAAFSLVLGTRLTWVSIPIILFASLPIALFALLQLPLFIQMVKSTYGFSSFQ